jgi:hypothetical protein
MHDKNTLMQSESRIRSVVSFIVDRELDKKFPAFMLPLDALNSRMDKIKNLRLFRSASNSKSKKEKRKEICLAAFSLGSAVYAYAQISGNTVLKNSIYYTVSDLFRPKEEIMNGRIRQILNAIKKVKNPDHYNLTPEVLEKFDSTYKKYLEYSKLPMGDLKKIARSRRQRARLLAECLEIVQKQIDPLIAAVNVQEAYSIYRKYNKASGRKRKYVKKQKPVQKTLQSSEHIEDKAKVALLST